MSGKMRIRTFLAVGAAVSALAAFASGRLSRSPQDPAAVLPLEKTVAVAADAGWVDTSIDVGPGDELRFSASGRIDLQRGNPEALCGPEGLDLVTVDQPVPNVHIGALIGKVAQLVAQRVDGNSGLEIRDEVFVLFPIGPEGTVTVPFKGRLYLGINENVLKDNAGGFSVVVVRRPL
jgi:protein involved in polysaccharide export with SLBB domain